MPQYDRYSVTVTNGSSLVTGTVGVDWSAFQAGATVFFIKSTNAPYFVGAIRQPSQNASGLWELNLTAPFAGASGTFNNYALNNSFSPVYGIPLLNYGDSGGNILFTQAMLILERLMQEFGVTALGGSTATNVRLDGSGNMQIKNVTTNTWRYLVYMGQPGAETLVGLETYSSNTNNWVKDGDGNLMILNTDTGQFRYIFFSGQEGAETAIGTNTVN